VDNRDLPTSLERSRSRPRAVRKRVKELLGDAPNRLRDRRPSEPPDPVLHVKPICKASSAGATSGFRSTATSAYRDEPEADSSASTSANAYECMRANQLRPRARVRPVLWQDDGFRTDSPTPQLCTKTSTRHDLRAGRRRVRRRWPLRGRAPAQSGREVGGMRPRASEHPRSGHLMAESAGGLAQSPPFRATAVDRWEPAGEKGRPTAPQRWSMTAQSTTHCLPANLALGEPLRLRALLVLGESAQARASYRLYDIPLCRLAQLLALNNPREAVQRLRLSV